MYSYFPLIVLVVVIVVIRVIDSLWAVVPIRSLLLVLLIAVVPACGRMDLIPPSNSLGHPG